MELGVDGSVWARSRCGTAAAEEPSEGGIGGVVAAAVLLLRQRRCCGDDDKAYKSSLSLTTPSLSRAISRGIDVINDFVAAPGALRRC